MVRLLAPRGLAAKPCPYSAAGPRAGPPGRRTVGCSAGSAGSGPRSWSRVLPGRKALEFGRFEPPVSCRPVPGPSAHRFSGLCMGEPLGADEGVPGLDAGGHDPLREFPWVFGEAAVDVRFAWRACDQQNADAAPFAAGERPGEEDEALLGECVHERGVVAGAGLLKGAFPVGPGRPGIAGDSVVTHG